MAGNDTITQLLTKIAEAKGITKASMYIVNIQGTEGPPNYHAIIPHRDLAFVSEDPLEMAEWIMKFTVISQQHITPEVEELVEVLRSYRDP